MEKKLYFNMEKDDGVTSVPVAVFKVRTMTDKTTDVPLTEQMKTLANARQYLIDHGSLPAGNSSPFIKQGVILEDSAAVGASDSLVHLFYYEPAALVDDPIESATGWDAKNRMKVFRGLYLASVRQFKEAAPLLIESLTSFTETEFMSFAQIAKYAMVCGILALTRSEINEQLIKSPEILEVAGEMRYLERLVHSFYHCRYAEFFSALAECEQNLKGDYFVGVHVAFIVKELRIRAYAQILRSYSCLSLEFVAQAFGVTSAFIEQDLARFIAAGRLDCVIDKVSGMVVTSVPDQRNAEYVAFMKKSDALMASMQKLGRTLSV